MEIVIDIECDSLTPSKIWCIVCRRLDNNEVSTFVYGINLDKFSSYAKDVTHWIGHNLIQFDLPVINKLLGIDTSRAKITDTLVLSRMLHFQIEGGHSLAAWGSRLKIPKWEWNDWSQYSDKMLEYCIQDTNVTLALYKFLIDKFKKFDCEEAIRIEHSIAYICKEMHDGGFSFDYDKAQKIRAELQEQLEYIDQRIKRDFPPKSISLGLVCPKLTKHGTISRTNLRWWKGNDLSVFRPGDKSTLDGCCERFEYQEFNPQSHKQVIERLEGHWDPTEKTTSHKEDDGKDKNRSTYLSRYGWKLSETNLATLRDTAPLSARLLVLRLLYSSRLRSLTEWFNAYNEKDKRVHGNFNHIGSWTHRMSHTAPNMGNVATEKSIKYKTKELSELAIKYGKEMRSLWTTDLDQESWLVGTDAEGIQLRIFAHYINDPKFIFAVTQGKKEDGSDPHSLNQQALGRICKTRDNAKTLKRLDVYKSIELRGTPRHLGQS